MSEPDRTEQPIQVQINRGKLTQEIVDSIHSRLLQRLASIKSDPDLAEAFSKSGFSKNGHSRSTFSKSAG